MLHRLASSLHRCQHYINPCRNRHKTGQNCPTQMWRQRRRYFSTLLRKIRKTNFFLGNCQWNSSLHRFCSLKLFFVEALRQWWWILEAMKRWNINYGKKLKQWSDQAFNADKDIEAMKRLTQSNHFIASVAQLCSCTVPLRQILGIFHSNFFFLLRLFKLLTEVETVLTMSYSPPHYSLLIHII